MDREMGAEEASFEKLARRLGGEGLGSVEALKGRVEGRVGGMRGRVREGDGGGEGCGEERGDVFVRDCKVLEEVGGEWGGEEV